MYVEEKKPHGNDVFTFIRSESELSEWKEKGYRLETEPSSQPGISRTDESKIIHVLESRWKKISWKDQNEIYSKSLKQTTDGQGKNKTELDAILYRDLKLKIALIGWNVKDNTGAVIPVTPENIDALVPDVAMELLNTFEKLTEATS